MFEDFSNPFAPIKDGKLNAKYLLSKVKAVVSNIESSFF